MGANTLTDDAIDSFIVSLSEWIMKNKHSYVADHDPDYDRLTDFVYKELEDFSNGYKNYN